MENFKSLLLSILITIVFIGSIGCGITVLKNKVARANCNRRLEIVEKYPSEYNANYLKFCLENLNL